MEGSSLTPMDGNKYALFISCTYQHTVQRVEGIVNAVKRYYTAFDIPMPAEKIYGIGTACPRMGCPILIK